MTTPGTELQRSDPNQSKWVLRLQLLSVLLFVLLVGFGVKLYVDLHAVAWAEEPQVELQQRPLARAYIWASETFKPSWAKEMQTPTKYPELPKKDDGQ